MDKIMVSICCITYNHEKYLKQALDSFLMQKTSFNYEIIIHDDASTDGTKKIIKEYEKKYPNIINPIYQSENQYSKGEKPSFIAMQKAKGKYIALCEGDDYWCDENKLQMQVNYLEKNPECSFCFHKAKVLDMRNSKMYKWHFSNKKYNKKNGIYNAGELDIYGFIPTASYMFRSKYVKEIPEWYKKAVVGDRTLKLIMTSYGYAYCVNRIMSVYRMGTGNSATDNLKKNMLYKEKMIEHWNKIEWIIDRFNEFSQYKYNEQLKISKDEIEKNRLVLNEQYKEIIKNKKYRKFINKRMMSIYILKKYFPFMYRILKKTKRYIKSKI